jgi:hypothetical protein
VADSTVQKAVHGDETVLAQIYDTYAPDIDRHILSKVGKPPDAEDLTAQTVMGVLESWPHYRHRGQFSAGIFRIARTRSLIFSAEANATHCKSGPPDVQINAADLCRHLGRDMAALTYFWCRAACCATPDMSQFPTSQYNLSMKSPQRSVHRIFAPQTRAVGRAD